MDKIKLNELLDIWEKAYLETVDGDPETFPAANVAMDNLIDYIPFKNEAEKDHFLSIVETFKDPIEVRMEATRLFKKNRRYAKDSQIDKIRYIEGKIEDIKAKLAEIEYLRPYGLTDVEKVTEKELTEELDRLYKLIGRLNPDTDVKDSEGYDPKVEERTNTAWLMNKVISSMNNESAYMSWIYLWPDGETFELCQEDFGENEENFNELVKKFERLYKKYHNDGLYLRKEDNEIIEFAEQMDSKFGLEPIEIIKKYELRKDSKPMKIKFKNGYTVEVLDSEGMTKSQIVKEAYKAMQATKRFKKHRQDSNPSITYKSNLISHISKIKSAIDKRTGEVIDPEVLDYEINNLEIDMDADLNHDKWYKKYDPKALQVIVEDYQKYIDALKLAKDETVEEKVAALELKLKEIKEIFKLADEVEDIEYTEDIKIEDGEDVEDMGVKDPTASYALNPDPYFSTDNIDDANEYLNARDPQKKAAAIKILKNEFPAIRKNIENDIANADELIEKFTKDQLRIFLDTYRNIINVYATANLMAEYKTLDDLLKELYYNQLHLNRKMGRSITGTRSVIARRGK